MYNCIMALYNLEGVRKSNIKRKIEKFCFEYTSVSISLTKNMCKAMYKTYINTISFKVGISNSAKRKHTSV